MLLPTLRNAPVANSTNAESINVSVISATRCERRFRTFFFLKKVNRRKRFRNPAHRSKFKLYRPLGYIIVPKILTHIQQANQIRMIFSAGIHPPQTFLANQDDFPRRNSSLQDISCNSGCFSPLGIIPGEQFCRIRMHFSAGNHPSQTFPANQDDFLHSKSSLPDISAESGCILPLGIIPPRHFLQIRMIFSAGIHPYKTFPANQDDFPRRNSSLQDISIKSG